MSDGARRLRPGLAAIVVAMVGIALVVALGQRVPRHRGKTSAGWFAEFVRFPQGEGGNGLRALGPDAVAYLVKELKARHPVRASRGYAALWRHADVAPWVQDQLPLPVTPAVFRERAADGLGLVDLDSSLAVEALAEACRSDPNSGVRWHALRSLWLFGTRASGAVPAVMEVLEGDPLPANRAYAASVLRRMGRAARPAVPALVRATEDPAAEVREAAGRALVRFAPEWSRMVSGAPPGFEAAEPRGPAE